MRFEIDIDDNVMDEALAASGFQTKNQAVEEALKLFIKTRCWSKHKELKGKRG